MKKIPLTALVPEGRTAKQCRAQLRRNGFRAKDRRWVFTPRKAKVVSTLLA